MGNGNGNGNSNSVNTVTGGNVNFQWQLNGSSGQGQWKMSSDTKSSYSSLNSYSIVPGSTCTFNFNTECSSTVFATMADGPPDNQTTNGFMFSSNSSAMLEGYKTQGALVLTAGQLISGDPKIQLSTDTTDPTSCNMEWRGGDWRVTDPDGNTMTPGDNGYYLLYAEPGTSATVNVTDTTVTGTSHYCAVYSGSRTTNSGPVQSLTPIDNTSAYPIPIRGDTGFTCTLNLFLEPSTSGSSTVPA